MHTDWFLLKIFPKGFWRSFTRQYPKMNEEELHQDPKKQLLKGECYEILISDQLA
jgi:hypothetical protein